MKLDHSPQGSGQNQKHLKPTIPEDGFFTKFELKSWNESLSLKGTETNSESHFCPFVPPCFFGFVGSPAPSQGTPLCDTPQKTAEICALQRAIQCVHAKNPWTGHVDPNRYPGHVEIEDHGIGDGTQQHVEYIYLGIHLHKEAALNEQVAGPKSPEPSKTNATQLRLPRDALHGSKPNLQWVLDQQ